MGREEREGESTEDDKKKSERGRMGQFGPPGERVRARGSGCVPGRENTVGRAGGLRLCLSRSPYRPAPPWAVVCFLSEMA